MTPAEVKRLPGGNLGALSTGSGTPLPVRAYERADGVLMLILMLTGENGTGESIDGAELEYFGARGVVRVTGHADFEEHDVVRFTASAPPEILQRREFVRVPAPRTVMISSDPEGTAYRGHTIDLSGGGMLINGVEDLAEGTEIAFSLELNPQEPPLTGRARVVRTYGDGRHGLVFQELSATERERLIRFVFECLRAARARTRGDL